MKRQVDYNKIASNLFKYSFDFDLTVTESYENFSKEFKEIAIIFQLIKQRIIDGENVTPFLIQDNESQSGVYLIENCIYRNVGNELVIEGFSINKSDNNIITFNYTFDDDTLVVTTDQDEFLTSDNVKSVFNQSITGTGNITLFRHKLKISVMSSTVVRDVILDYLSTSNLVVDNLQDLATLLNVSRNDTSDTAFLGYLGVKNYSITYKYSTGIFELSDGTNHYNATSVSDKVTTI